MKKGIAALALSFALVFCAGTVYGAEAHVLEPIAEEGVTKEYGMVQEAVDAVGDPDPELSVGIYNVTISFSKNGGSGVMENQTVASNSQTLLAQNIFSRKSYTFTGWNTMANGKGIPYADGQDVTQLATESNHGQTITLYAQWTLNAPKLKKLKTTVPGALKITYSKVSKASSYQLQYSTSKKFKKATSVKLKKGTSSAEINDLVPGKTYYVRIRSYDKKKYSAWSKVLSKKTKNGSTLVNTKALTGIEADITMSGSGSGFHAKLVLVTPLSAVSYGIQYDRHAVAPYTGKAMAMIENVASNAAGGQSYTRPGNKELQVGKKYHFMITIDKNGRGDVYLDYKKIGSFSNSHLANTAVYPRVEAAVRLNGDSVKATFDNIRMRRGGTLQKGLFPDGRIEKSNSGIKTKRTKNQNKVVISGTGRGINGDWDSDYERVSGIYSF